MHEPCERCVFSGWGNRFAENYNLFLHNTMRCSSFLSVIDEDFTLNQTQQVFYYQTSTEVCLQFRIINDMFIENYSEMLIPEITVGNNNDTIEGPVSVHIVINDNDCKDVQQQLIRITFMINLKHLLFCITIQ